MKMHFLAALLAALSIQATAAFAEQQGVTDTEIVIGDVMPLTGPPALAGIAHNMGVRVAVAEVNAAGGINGRKVRLITEDDGYVNTRTIQAARKLATVDKVFGITTVSGANQGLAALPVIEQTGVLTFSVMGFSKQLYEPVKKNIFVIGQTYDVLFEELTTFMAREYPGRKWGIVSQDDESGEIVRDGFERAAKANSLQVVSRQIYKKGQQDFSSEMARFKRDGGEALIAGGIVNENVAMMKELERLGLRVPTGMFYVGRYPVTLELMGPVGNGTFWADYVEAETGPKGAAFMDRVRKVVGDEEAKKANRFTLTGYASARTMFEAIRRCGKAVTWACGIDELERMNGFDTGVMGPISFSKTSHFSVQKPILMEAVYETRSYKPAQ
ncbi:ABC transporter substrate-binding protein [Pseudacidovorax sp. NFM-22]|uniref:ABC transporter substrate-binding protein n=1 Tax=Pseudacidovorax sp. NFM-22 TaxID=2744469 RepID=UPI001F39E741|nr:ABC transporter substrate-binding protein [Pseudacidovorax sp. NFM-22]